MSTIQNLELERRWLDAHVDGLIDDLPGDTAVDLADLPWDEDASR
jgi:hypothetical protein